MLKRNDEESSYELLEEETGGWIVTFADLVTLLLVFFVLMFSISTMNLHKFKYAIKSIQLNLGEENPAVDLLEIITEPEPEKKKISIEDIVGIKTREQKMMDDINDIIDETQLGDHVVLVRADGKIMVRIKGAVLFESGAAILNPDSRPILDQIVRIINDYSEYNVNIKGHTDDKPIRTEKFPSNWELSSIRATNVLKYMIRSGVDPIRLTATGYAELLPLVENDSTENRSINRRVEFVLEKKKGGF
jgi:chemotaxis protein MotB